MQRHSYFFSLSITHSRARTDCEGRQQSVFHCGSFNLGQSDTWPPHEPTRGDVSQIRVRPAQGSYEYFYRSSLLFGRNMAIWSACLWMHSATIEMTPCLCFCPFRFACILHIHSLLIFVIRLLFVLATNDHNTCAIRATVWQLMSLPSMRTALAPFTASPSTLWEPCWNGHGPRWQRWRIRLVRPQP